MLLECPKCHTQYNVDDSVIPATGRNMRCSSCGYFWRQTPIKENGAQTFNEETTPNRFKTAAASVNTHKAKANNKPKQSVKPNLRPNFERDKFIADLSSFAGWFLAILILIIVILIGVANREAIIKKWPNSSSFFSLLGARTNLYGIEITQINVNTVKDSKGSRIFVSGVIKSTSDIATPVPYIRINILNKLNKKVDSWITDPGIIIISPRAEQYFETSKAVPLENGLKAVVTFNDPPKEVARPKGKEVYLKRSDTFRDDAQTNVKTPDGGKADNIQLEGSPDNNGAKNPATK